MERPHTKRQAVELSSRKYPMIAPPLCFWYFPGVSIFNNSYFPLRIILISLCISNRLLLHRQLVKSIIFIKILLRIFLFNTYHNLILFMKLCLKSSLLSTLSAAVPCKHMPVRTGVSLPLSSFFPDSAHPPTRTVLYILPEKCHIPWE